MVPAVIAVDAGGTSTRAAVVGLTGDVLGVGRAGAGNPISSGVELATANVVEACRQALAQSGNSERIVSSLVTMAGGANGSTPTDGLVARLIDSGVPGPLAIDSDVLSAYFSGSPASEGAVLIVGTGAVAGRISDGLLARVADGLGWLLGDAGSGFWIGRRAAIAAAADLDGRGEPTALTDDVLAEYGLTRGRRKRAGRPEVLSPLVHEIYGRRPIELARLAPIVLRHPDDPVASLILEGAANALTNTITSLLGDDDVPLVLAGGLIGPASALHDRMSQRLAGRHCLTATDGLAGAALMALRRVGAEANQAVHARLVAALAARTLPVGPLGASR